MNKGDRLHVQTQLYIQDPEYCELLLNCKDICNQIYIARNISLSQDSILDALKKIDILMRDKESNN